MPLSRTEAANVTMSIINASTRAYINMPGEFVNYAAAAGFYVTTAWPGDNPATYLPSANARGPEMADAIQRYVTMASKVFTFQFTRTGTYSLTADPAYGSQGDGVLASESSKPRPGTVSTYRAYYPSNTGAGSGGQVYTAINSFRQVSGPGSFSVNNGTAYFTQQMPAYQAATSFFQFTINNVSNISRAAITSSGFDDWTCVVVNGHIVDVYNGYIIRKGLQHRSTAFSFDGTNVNCGAAGTFPVSVQVGLGQPYVMTANLNDDIRPYIFTGVNTLELRGANYTAVSLCTATLEIVENASSPGNGQIVPDPPGYSAVISGNASYSKMVNLLNNLAGKLYARMVSNIYYVTFCHTNCHNNCHASRGRR